MDDFYVRSVAYPTIYDENGEAISINCVKLDFLVDGETKEIKSVQIVKSENDHG